MRACQGLRKYLLSHLPVGCSAWPVVEAIGGGDGFGVVMGVNRRLGVLGQVLAQPPVGFPQVLRCLGLWGSQKYSRTPVLAARSAWRDISLHWSNVKVWRRKPSRGGRCPVCAASGCCGLLLKSAVAVTRSGKVGAARKVPAPAARFGGQSIGAPAHAFLNLGCPTVGEWKKGEDPAAEPA